MAVPDGKALPFTDTLAFHPSAAPLLEMYKSGNVAIVQGIGYGNSSRSHFRAMDIWHTCEPLKIATEAGWRRLCGLIDPEGSNPLTAVSFRRGLPRALAALGVTATSVDNLDNYGLLNSIEWASGGTKTSSSSSGWPRTAIGTGMVMDYLSQTGNGVLSGADMLKIAPEMYHSNVEYPSNPIAKSLRDVVRVHTANLGTRVFYTQHGGYDYHAQEVPSHTRLLGELTTALSAFMQDLRESTTLLTTSPSSSSPSSGAASRTTVTAPTTARVAARSSSATTSRAGSTRNTRLWSRRSG